MFVNPQIFGSDYLNRDRILLSWVRNFMMSVLLNEFCGILLIWRIRDRIFIILVVIFKNCDSGHCEMDFCGVGYFYYVGQHFNDFLIPTGVVVSQSDLDDVDDVLQFGAFVMLVIWIMLDRILNIFDFA